MARTGGAQAIGLGDEVGSLDAEGRQAGGSDPREADLTALNLTPVLTEPVRT
jgi:hypothetical protein